ncbi:hypothetical protein SLEP1_g53198 [Rubroshorea leprosula]|uniref:N-acetyltransferase domain-containing protein n=1 Tax=Rubroshorea leprosula TaxID=152421 RepID=A0AAV5MBI3_9ROSI|nr:hypothetical protein SLEP1_g53198 [Rubroshorea leprosula]
MERCWRCILQHTQWDAHFRLIIITVFTSGIGMLSLFTKQIRYTAIEEDHQKKKLGRKVLMACTKPDKSWTKLNVDCSDIKHTKQSQED